MMKNYLFLFIFLSLGTLLFNCAIFITLSIYLFLLMLISSPGKWKVLFFILNPFLLLPYSHFLLYDSLCFLVTPTWILCLKIIISN